MVAEHTSVSPEAEKYRKLSHDSTISSEETLLRDDDKVMSRSSIRRTSLYFWVIGLGICLISNAVTGGSDWLSLVRAVDHDPTAYLHSIFADSYLCLFCIGSEL